MAGCCLVVASPAKKIVGYLHFQLESRSLRHMNQPLHENMIHMTKDHLTLPHLVQIACIGSGTKVPLGPYMSANMSKEKNIIIARIWK